MVKITDISYDIESDTFTAQLDMPALLEISYNGTDDCTIRLLALPGMIMRSRYFNSTALIADALRAIIDAQEEQAAELPCDLTMPIDVKDTFNMPAVAA